MMNPHLEYQSNELTGGKLLAARILWWSLAVLTIGLLVVALPVEYQTWLKEARNLYAIELLELNLPETFYAGYHTLLDSLLTGVFIVTGLIIYLNRSKDWYLMLVSMTSMAFGVVFTPALVSLMQFQPALTIPIGFVRTVGLALSVIAGFYLFPNGRFVPRMTRYLAIAWAALAFGWFFFPQMPANLVYVTTWTQNLGLSIALYGAAYLSGAVSQIFRYSKVSGPVQRQQTKWFVFGTAAAVIGFLLYFLPLIFVPELNEPNRSKLLYEFVAKPIYHLLVVMAPISITVSILRFRLWDVDRLLNHSLVYGVLTIVLGFVYLGVVLFIRSFLLGFTQYSSTLTTIVSTLAIAALFTPLRTAIQALIDQRFFRKKYNASKTLEAFRKRMRNKVEIHQLSQEIIDLVDETVQPEHVSLWLIPRGEKARRSEKQTDQAVRNEYRNEMHTVET